MLYYIKKKWFQSAQVCFLLVVEWGLQALASLIMIKTFDAIFRLDVPNFLFWTGINLATWGAYFATSCLREIVQARAIRILNNQVRHDLYRTLLGKNNQDFHGQDSGEYISWLTNDVKQIENLAWEAIFCMCWPHCSGLLVYPGADLYSLVTGCRCMHHFPAHVVYSKGV